MSVKQAHPGGTVPEEEITIPDHLEEVFVVWGPPTFSRLIETAGGKIRASKMAKVSSSTMSRWSQSPPGVQFGQRVGTYRSLWFGYPSPFPGLDRIVEHIRGPKHSFLGEAIKKHGLASALSQIKDPSRFGLQMLDLHQSEILDAANDIRIPAMTRRRWTTGTPYPKQWAGLDHLAQKIDGTSWLHSVINHGESTGQSRKISREGVGSMARAVLHDL